MKKIVVEKSIIRALEELKNIQKNCTARTMNPLTLKNIVNTVFEQYNQHKKDKYFQAAKYNYCDDIRCNSYKYPAHSTGLFVNIDKNKCEVEPYRIRSNYLNKNYSQGHFLQYE